MMRMRRRWLRLASLIGLKIKVVMIKMVMKGKAVGSLPIIPTQTRVITSNLNLITSDTLVLNNQTTITQTTILLQMTLNMPLEHTHYHIGYPHHWESPLAVLAHTCFS